VHSSSRYGADRLKVNASDIPVIERMQNPVAPKIVEAPYTKIPDFRRAYNADGMTVAEFDGYGATVRTLCGFIAAVHELTGIVRDYMLPAPDMTVLTGEAR
jgi:transaldolase